MSEPETSEPRLPLSDAWNIVVSYGAVAVWWSIADSPLLYVLATVFTIALAGLNLLWLNNFQAMRFVQGRLAEHKWWKEHLKRGGRP